MKVLVGETENLYKILVGKYLEKWIVEREGWGNFLWRSIMVREGGS
jgi:hypothetical protein